MKEDIKTEGDIKLLVDTFYERVNANSVLSPVFNDEAKVNWEEHLPKMYRFWGTLLIGTMNYSGNAFAPHAKLPVEAEHFNNWLHLFITTVDENFAGPTAEQAKDRAKSIANIFQYKLGILK